MTLVNYDKTRTENYTVLTALLLVGGTIWILVCILPDTQVQRDARAESPVGVPVISFRLMKSRSGNGMECCLMTQRAISADGDLRK